MEAEIYISIEQYLANEMTPSEKLAFEERLRNDHDLAEKLEIYKSASTTLHAKFNREEREAAFKNNIAKIATENHDDKEGKVVKLNWYTWAAAASVAILCAVLFYTSISKPDFEDFANYEPIALVERGTEDAIKQEAQEAFNNQQYARAAELFTALLAQDNKNSELQLYKGIALLELNQISEANELLNTVRTSSSVYADKAVWMLALSALKEKDYKKCESLLKEIPSSSEEFENAQRLLNKLD